MGYKSPTTFWGEFDTEDEANSTIQGIKRLACALILRAALDSRGQLSGTYARETKKKPREPTRSAIRWLLLNEGNEPASFLWCCEVLNIAPSVLRSKLGTLKDIGSIKRFFYSLGGIRMFDQPKQYKIKK